MVERGSGVVPSVGSRGRAPGLQKLIAVCCVDK